MIQGERGQEEAVNIHTPRDLYGGLACQGQDLHRQEAVQIPQLDRYQHQGVQCRRVQKTGDHTLQVCDC